MSLLFGGSGPVPWDQRLNCIQGLAGTVCPCFKGPLLIKKLEFLCVMW